MKCPYSFIIENDRYHRKDYQKNPLKLYNGTVVPCGKCLICKLNRSSEWAARLIHELQYYTESSFITLTYSPENVPMLLDGSLSLFKKDYQNFVKRFRKEVKKKIKYFLCGEYGEKGDRPHYHAIIFGWQPKIDELYPIKEDKGKTYYSCELLERTWKNGQCSIGSVTNDSIHYTTGYILKDGATKNNIGNKTPSFLSASQGLGLSYAQEHKEEIKNLEISAEGQTCAIPRYYIKKLSTTIQYSDVKTRKVKTFKQGGVNKSKITFQKREKELALMRKAINQKLITKDNSLYATIIKKVEASRLQNEKQIAAKMRLLKKDKT